MAEYISREAIKQVLCGIANGLSVEETKAFKTKGVKALYKIQGAKEILNAIDNDLSFIPAADVQPVVHAYWIELSKALNPNENPCKCSNCGHVLSFMNYYPKSKYCDDCGARMDGDAE